MARGAFPETSLRNRLPRCAARRPQGCARRNPASGRFVGRRSGGQGKAVRPKPCQECFRNPMLSPTYCGWGVDFMGNSGRKLSNRLEFLGLVPLSLHYPAVGDVVRHSRRHQLAVMHKLIGCYVYINRWSRLFPNAANCPHTCCRASKSHGALSAPECIRAERIRLDRHSQKPPRASMPSSGGRRVVSSRKPGVQITDPHGEGVMAEQHVVPLLGLAQGALR